MSVNYLETLDGFAALPSVAHINASVNHIASFQGIQAIQSIPAQCLTFLPVLTRVSPCSGSNTVEQLELIPEPPNINRRSSRVPQLDRTES